MWHPLRRFEDPTIPKLHNLARAAARSIRIPKTMWTHARSHATAPPPGLDFPLIVRSGSPTEDTHETSNAGQLLSLPVHRAADFEHGIARVIDALPRDDAGDPRGVVFVQPLIQAKQAGVAFFDGFYFERTAARGGNEALTSGKDRGDVARGHLERGDPWSAWLTRVHAVFADIPRIDIEYAEDDAGFILLQARPALFPVARSETLSLANHKEILGDPPSPWIVSVLIEAGRDVLDFFAAIDPAIRAWDEPYAVEIAERAWMNFSFFFRLMDRWGLPRSFVTQGVGGESGGARDGDVLLFRFLYSAARLLKLQAYSLGTLRRAPVALRGLDDTIAAADSLHAVYLANVKAMALAIRTNFAIGGILSGISRFRKACGIEGTARVVTEEMMHRYQAISHLRTPRARARALDDWLAAYGHRGPLESDPARPRFAELRDLLWNDLEASTRPAASTSRNTNPAHDVQPANSPPPAHAAHPSSAASAPEAEEAGAFFWIDTRREWFRDELMKRWQTLRAEALAHGRILVERGRLDAPDDVFQLRAAELAALTEDPSFDARGAVKAARARREAVSGSALPLTASRHAITQALAAADRDLAAAAGKRLFPGIPLSPAVVEGPALKVHDLTDLLAASGKSGGIDPATILVVGALEPSWAVVFPRVRGVVAEIGGELSHASILLREARKPAIVNCKDICRTVQTGDRLRIDGTRGVVEILR